MLAELCQHTEIEDKQEYDKILGAYLFKNSWTVFSETDVKGRSGSPLKGLLRGCGAQGCESRSD